MSSKLTETSVARLVAKSFAMVFPQSEAGEADSNWSSEAADSELFSAISMGSKICPAEILPG